MSPLASSARTVPLPLSGAGAAHGDERAGGAAAAAALGADCRVSGARRSAGFAPVGGPRRRGGTIVVPGGTALLLDESYNANGASMRAALAVLRLQPARRRIAVLGDMLELGDEAAGRARGAGRAVIALAPTCCSPAAR